MFKKRPRERAPEPTDGPPGEGWTEVELIEGRLVPVEPRRRRPPATEPTTSPDRVSPGADRAGPASTGPGRVQHPVAPEPEKPKRRARAAGTVPKDRYKGLSDAEKVEIPDDSDLACDVECLFARGMKTGDVLREVGLPSNRFTWDQARRFRYGAQVHLATAPPVTLEDAQRDVERLRGQGVAFTGTDVDEAVDRALRRTAALRARAREEQAARARVPQGTEPPG